MQDAVFEHMYWGLAGLPTGAYARDASLLGQQVLAENAVACERLTAPEVPCDL